ncbi:GNAT family N-acetyltransferase [Clostridium estertheticum]|uniref:GNAT family N-acetyltransferase n=1 Tax=Clostridium estertheticum TaxID=238834 RepID=A0AA47EHU9_9CLOT|nr:GNAT family N-acetyltransferase [Clostridium estertheticum]MBU3154347.1 GNAT family N-acetyltransferase [Clostridium estertheticum]MBU3197886.1 GNAT family N-acetyltransferase [Clostridium estertheticum]WAG60236.1 GNAT family N-acetyltransferase [Clostridium estertheticum]WAG65686.1 GNAT family N-acetyltransferase [Clostridium estertheticum]
MIESRIKNLENTTIKNVFTIECKNIILKEFELTDLDEIYDLTLQHEITDFLPDWIATKEKRREWLVNYEIKENTEFLEVVPNIKGHTLRLGIVLKETNQIIGWCCSGLKDKLPLPNREIAYAISKNYRNKGYTTEAAQGLIKYLYESTNLETLNAIALTYNKSSNRVIEKCGFNFISNIHIENQEFYYYKLSKVQWEKNL